MASSTPKKHVFYFISGGRVAIFILLLVANHAFPENFIYVFGQDTALYALSGIAFILTGAYVAWFKRQGLSCLLLWAQTILDILLVSATVYITGECKSPFTFLYPVSIISACLLGGRFFGTVSALAGTLSFALLCWRSIGYSSNFQEALFSFFVNMAAFNLIALLTFSLSERVRTTEEELFRTSTDLRRMQEIQQHLANSMRSGLITVDQEGRVLFFNISALEILGPAIEKGYGKKLAELWPAGAGLLEALVLDQEVDRQEITYVDEDGQNRFLGISTFSIRDEEGKRLGYGLIFQDITEIKLKEKRLQRMDKLAALGEMAAGLAHEIRNPLASISGATQFLEETGLVLPEGTKLLKIISRETSRLNQLTHTFLLYGRPEKGERKLVDVGDEISATVNLVRQRRRAHDISMDIHVEEGLKLAIDPDQFRQIILNLLMNAVQALPDKGGKIEIKSERQEDQIVIQIADNGRGVKVEDIPRIFDPFFTTRPDGTGLGLSIVHRLVSDYGGSISLDSAEGAGACFSLTFPCNAQPQPFQPKDQGDSYQY